MSNRSHGKRIQELESHVGVGLRRIVVRFIHSDGTMEGPEDDELEPGTEALTVALVESGTNEELETKYPGRRDRITQRKGRANQ